jgi:hypothetical protein
MRINYRNNKTLLENLAVGDIFEYERHEDKAEVVYMKTDVGKLGIGCVALNTGYLTYFAPGVLVKPLNGSLEIISGVSQT